MIHLAVTGGIGSGKSTVCKILEQNNVPVYHADQRAKDIMIENPIVKAKIIELLGEKSYLNKQLNRAFIGNIVFNQPEKLQELNAIVHPAVEMDYIQWKQKQNAPYTVKEIAILFEINAQENYDKILTVTAHLEIRIQRVILRNKSSRKQVIDRINQQFPESKKIQNSDYVIYNNNSLALLEQETINIHKEIIKSLNPC